MKWAFDVLEASDLKPAHRLVLLALCWDHTDAEGCFPSQQRISQYAGYRERKVRDVLADLERLGLIRRRKVRAYGKFARTEYTLFGSISQQVKTTEEVGHQRHKKADGDHRHTGADNRGTTKVKDASGVSVAPFPFQEKETGGMA